jgi:AsmA protein
MNRLARWLGGLLGGLLLVVAGLLVAITVFGLNWARAPLEARVLAHTGRALHIDGDLRLEWGWPSMRWRANAVRFANPPWAGEPQMVVADKVVLGLDLSELLGGRLVIPELQLSRPRVFLEQASGGRKSWLLDPSQTDENSVVPIGRVRLDEGELHFDDVAQRTAIHASFMTRPDGSRVLFKAGGSYLGQRLVADGEGGSVMAWRDDLQPYPLRVVATLDRTQVSVEGTVSNLHQFLAVDVQLAVSGDNLATLYGLTGVALPPTPAYRSAGHLTRRAGVWRYEAFTAHLGRSDVAGTLQVTSSGPRKRLSGELLFQRLSLADLGPAAGMRETTAASRARVLPELPLNISQWPGLDADVTLRVQTLLSRQVLPLHALYARLLLIDSRLALDPIAFDWAGGQVTARLVLDGRKPPLRGQVKAVVRGVALAQLLPASAATRGLDLGRLDGDAELAGQGASVGRMLAKADGKLSLVGKGGQVSRMLMEQSGLHLLEILHLSLSGDESVLVNCAIADFEVTRGVMQSRKLVLDTSINTLVGQGSIDLSNETLNLVIVPRTKRTSIVALRTPVQVHGSLAHPEVSLDAGKVALRGAGALALGLLNPLLALVPLFEAGPGMANICGMPAR